MFKSEYFCLNRILFMCILLRFNYGFAAQFLGDYVHYSCHQSPLIRVLKRLFD